MGTASASETNGYGTGGYGQGAYGGETVDETRDETSSGPDDTDTSESSLEHTILFDGIGTSSGTEYEFTVTGTVERSRYGGASINEADRLEDGSVTGFVTGWRDAFRFSGEIDTLTVDGDARVYIDGTQVDPSDYGNNQLHVVTIVGNGTYTEYEIKSDQSITVIEGEDAVVASEGRAEGSIERGVHRLRLTGELVGFAFREGGTQAYLDTQRIDPADYDG